MGVLTPLISTEIRGEPVHIKAECLQRTGSFKLRGAWWRLSSIPAEGRAAGVVAFSSGNHAQGVAWAAQRLGMPALIVMPADAPAAKVAGTQAAGAEILFYDRLTESREAIAARVAQERGAVLVPSFDDPWIVEGQGTAGLEIAAQYRAQTGRDVERIAVCCGGGGLSSGIALGAPDADIIVAEPEGWDDMGESLRRGEIVPVQPDPPATSCDALQTLRVAPLTFDILKGRGATGVAVSEAEVAEAMRFAFERLKIVAEPGGAVALAAALAGKVSLAGTVLLVSGGNVDPATFRRLAS
ncbi:pyridoxal-phosphate dependent enzyme [Sphingomonas abietis]|uniref:Pyridoxal-phosphate dependent enzyme n=1 Tax=Sphingomonas abietis TaxID=3012344 RepID=A0ABY7NW47_9SPHN|nr:pyridoxal-phosphate dependent enzyme [Sphingomonas abietis]WBO24661.1 pyridoxal-phosphate dependent enzyme [Sphingomonas abietis]